MIFCKTAKKISFQKEKLIEGNQKCNNPGRGWYCIHSFRAKELIETEELKWCIQRENQLALVLIDIGDYSQGKIEDSALNNVRNILEFFTKVGQEMILRVVYDTEGKGMEKEPSLSLHVQNHMRQLGPIFEEYKESIFTLQGLFVGNWGEMHGSKFLSKEGMRTLATCMRQSTNGACRLAVRRPVQWRIIGNEDIGLFDDAMLASKSHMGTFGEKSRQDDLWEEPWSREDELSFEDELCKKVPMGGEVALGDEIVCEEEVIARFQKMHVSYLNCVYDHRILEEWKKTSFFDYVGNHLGYRLVVTDARMDAKKGKLHLEISNVGFAPIYDEVSLSLICIGKDDEVKEISISTSPQLWQKEKVQVTVEVLPQGEYSLYLALKRSKDSKPIYFANQAATDKVYLGLLCNGE